MYVGSVDGRVYAFSARGGDELWSFGTGSYVYASPAVWHGMVLVGSYDHTFYALRDVCPHQGAQLGFEQVLSAGGVGHHGPNAIVRLNPPDVGG